MSWTLRVRTGVAVVVAALVSALLVVVPAGPAQATTFPPGVARFAGATDWTVGSGFHFRVSFVVEPRVVPGYTADSLWVFKAWGGDPQVQAPSSPIVLDMQCPDGSWHEMGRATPLSALPQFWQAWNINGCGFGQAPSGFGMRLVSYLNGCCSAPTTPGTHLMGGVFSAGVFRVADPAAYSGGGNPDEGCTSCTPLDPVNMATGDLFESVTDVALPGSSPLAMSRTYSSVSAAKETL